MSEKITAKTGKMKKYIATKNCMYENRWVGRGEVIEIPADKAMEHCCFVETSSDTSEFRKASAAGVFYDPMSEAIESKKIDAVMAGVYRH